MVLFYFAEPVESGRISKAAFQSKGRVFIYCPLLPTWQAYSLWEGQHFNPGAGFPWIAVGYKDFTATRHSGRAAAML